MKIGRAGTPQVFRLCGETRRRTVEPQESIILFHSGDKINRGLFLRAFPIGTINYWRTRPPEQKVASTNGMCDFVAIVTYCPRAYNIIEKVSTSRNWRRARTPVRAASAYDAETIIFNHQQA